MGNEREEELFMDILASQMVQLQRWTQPTTTKEWARMDQEGSYKAALWSAHHRALVTSKDWKVGEEDHEPVPKVRVGVSLGLSLGPTPGLGPGPALEVHLGIGRGPIAKATIMVTHEAYVLSPLMDPFFEGE